MTDTSGSYETDTSVDDGTSTGSDQSGGSGPNPAWSEVLNVLPEQFHGIVTPHFQKWDQAAQEKITSTNAKYADYEPFAEHGITQAEITEGLRLMQAINQDPKGVYDALANAYGYTSMAEMKQDDPKAASDAVQDATGQNAGQAAQALNDPRVSKLEEGVNIMAQMLLEERQEAVNAQADSELDQELNGLKEKHGQFDEYYVLARMQQGLSGEKAVEAFNEMKNGLLQSNPRPFAPGIVGTKSGNGAGVPSNAIDVTQLDGKETRNLVAEMLKHAAQQS